MFPVLFEIGGFQVPSYAVMMALGYIVALVTIRALIPPRAASSSAGTETPPALDRGQALDLFIVMLVASLFGAKLGHVLFEAPGHIGADGRPINTVFELLREDPLHWLRLDDPGYVWYGGMIGALLTAAFYFRVRPGLNRWLYADAFAPAIMAGAAVGRLGCFMGGCCYGSPTDLPWGMTFVGVAGTVHPTQLYDAAIAAGLGIALWLRFAHRRFDGELIALLLMAYGVLRALTEVFRGDPERGGFGPLSTSQWISVPLFLLGLWLYLHRARTAGPATDPTKGVPNVAAVPEPAVAAEAQAR